MERIITLEDISKEIKLSSHYIERIFKLETENTIFEYLMKTRLEESKKFLKDVRYNVSEIADKVGYSDISYFCKLFKKHTGFTPSEYRFNDSFSTPF